MIRPMNAGPMNAEAIRARTAERLKTAGCSLPPHAPRVQTGPTERTLREVIQRALALGLTGFAAEGLDPAAVRQDIAKFELEPVLTPLEAACVARDASASLAADWGLSWQIVSCRTLLWAVELDIEPWSEREGEELPVRVLAARTVDDLERHARWRHEDEIVAEADFARCYRAIYGPSSITQMQPQRGPIGPEHAFFVAKALEWILNSSSGWADPV